MKYSRRECCVGLPAVIALAAVRAAAAADQKVPSKAYRFEDLPLHASGGNKSRPVLQGETHDGRFVEVHETDLAPGGMPHPPHHHAHEEMFLMREGELEVTIAGKTSRLDPGSVAFVASNEEHGVRNPGTTHAQYFVVAFGRD